MNKYKNAKLLSIVITILIGFLIGLFSTTRFNKDEIEIIYSNESFLKAFINSFTLNFWYFILLWYFGLFQIGFIVIYLIDFLKGVSIGITFSFVIKIVGLIGVFSFIKNALFELIIIMPSLIFISYKSIYSLKENKYKILFYITIIVSLYSLLKAL